MKKFEIKCNNCGNVDRFTIKEMSNLHFCQRCYKEHDKMCDVLANSVLELEQQNKRYREALEYVREIDCVDWNKEELAEIARKALEVEE